jgi:ADP-ribose pyrophosphatase YjhB (NUDIX family)
MTGSHNNSFKLCSKLEINSLKLNAVFMSFYSYVYNKKTKEKIPVVLMQMRKEGSIGFPGGKVESKDHQGNLNEYSLKKALVRELKEEINLEKKLDFSKMKHLCTHKSNDLYVHNFYYYLEEKDFLEVFSNANTRMDITQSSGVIICHLTNYGNGKGYRDFLKNNFKATSLSELSLLNSILRPKSKRF